ncbi:MAG: ribonuclease III [Acidimicrobiia bacterium]|nr:ribonuclease III [Acidimicrobiia bacterium]MDH4308722.1 ribonuclease III [Acidimicrobiia bacterium]MDH5292468.1 ribonuclease III [Acidimicrobiia bacterium]
MSLESALGHSFADPDLLGAALIHRSHTAENPSDPDNERLEFLGDAVLQLVVTDYLYANHAHLREGEMAKVRSACVNRDELAEIAGRLEVGRHLRLGVGEEQSGGRDKPSILADTMEAVLAAVYLDGGLEEARRVILDHWTDLIEAKVTEPGGRDYKTRLQELLAAGGLRPEYVVEGEGPDHARRFFAKVTVDGAVRGEGSGKSKKEAEQAAAKAALG